MKKGIGTQKKRILHISKYYAPFVGGTEKVAQNCVKALADADQTQYEQVVFCFDHGTGLLRDEESRGDVIDIVNGIQVVRCRCEAKIASQSLSLSYKKRLKAVFQKFRPDIVILHYPNPFATHYLLRLLQPDTRLIVFWHLDIVKQKFLGLAFRGQNRRLLERADRLIAASPDYMQGSPWLREYKEKCVIIPDCIDTEKFRKEGPQTTEAIRRIQKCCAGKILCLAVGRHVEYKGFRYLIESARYLDDRYVIVITGEGPLTKQLKKQAAELSASVGHGSGKTCAKIVFAGLISDEELLAYLHACDVFCFPSITKNEAFGIALAEAMYCAKPVVTYSIEGSGVNYVSIGGVTGIECPNKDSRSYARAIQELGENPDLRERYGQAGKRRVEEYFLYEQFADHIRSLFESL